jgi:F-box and leucine-rich repeat protein 1 (S-phase kinase-associated protein 2)
MEFHKIDPFKVSGLSCDGAVTLVKACQRLTELNLSWTGLTESAFDAISTELAASLTKLNISGHRESLRDVHIENIVDRCPNLTDLDVSDWSGIFLCQEGFRTTFLVWAK